MWREKYIRVGALPVSSSVLDISSSRWVPPGTAGPSWWEASSVSSAASHAPHGSSSTSWAPWTCSKETANLFVAPNLLQDVNHEGNWITASLAPCPVLLCQKPKGTALCPCGLSLQLEDGPPHTCEGPKQDKQMAAQGLTPSSMVPRALSLPDQSTLLLSRCPCSILVLI